MRGRHGAAWTLAGAAVVGIFAACVGDDPIAEHEAGDGGVTSGPIPPTKNCNGITVPTNDPKTGCAATACDPCPSAANQAAACDGTGACTTTCNAGFDDCDPAAPGCETPVSADPKACGACGHVCGTNANTTGASCDGGKCAFECVDPYRHCGSDDSLGCETNVGTSKDHCGACGHSCQGGDCVSGKCQKVLIAGDPATYVGLKSLYGLAVAGNQLFGTDWYQTNQGLVYKLPTSGVPDGGAVSFLVKAPVVTDGGVGGYPDGGSIGTSASPIVNDGTGKILYGIFRREADGLYADRPAAGIWEISTNGTDNRPLVKLADNQNIAAIAADANYIYFSEFWRFGGGNQYGIFRADRATGANVTRYFYGANDGTKGKIDNIFAEGGSIYFGDVASKKIYAASPTTLDSPLDLATTSADPGPVQTDATYVYYYDAGKFYRVKKLGGTPEDITPTPGLPTTVHAFLVDAENVYFFGPKVADYNVDNGQKLYAFPKGAKSADPPVVLTDVGADNVSATTQDATTIYWTTYGRDGTPPPYSAIYKIAKPVK